MQFSFRRAASPYGIWLRWHDSPGSSPLYRWLPCSLTTTQSAASASCSSDYRGCSSVALSWRRCSSRSAAEKSAVQERNLASINDRDAVDRAGSLVTGAHRL